MRGRTVIFLGSSVTEGWAAQGVSFVECLAQRCGIVPVKEAVSGTTLADVGDQSYVARLHGIDPAIQADAFVCQLSTNDASKGIPLGNIGTADTATVTGAIEHIIAYAQSTWRCPVVFYTGTRYQSPAYAAMVDRLHELAALHGVHVIDLWNDADMNAVSPDDYARYMRDPVHPTLEGYREWWTPKFEQALAKILK